MAAETATHLRLLIQDIARSETILKTANTSDICSLQTVTLYTYFDICGARYQIKETYETEI